MTATLVIRNAAQLVRGSSRGPEQDAALLVRDGHIAWLGPTADLPPLPPDTATIDAAGKVVLPGLVDSHTHLIFAGVARGRVRAAAAGPQLPGDRRARRRHQCHGRQRPAGSRDELKALARRRLERLLQFGVTTVEVKSGYGLTLADETQVPRSRSPS